MTTNPTTTISLLDRLKRGDKLISDGGSGTYLQANGLEPGGSPELMNIEQPKVVRQMAADFFAAGLAWPRTSRRVHRISVPRKPNW